MSFACDLEKKMISVVQVYACIKGALNVSLSCVLFYGHQEMALFPC